MDTSKFAELGLNEQILAGVAALGFTDPTPVQAEAIPLVLAGRDVVASAQTGTGKTAAFALPVLQVIQPYSEAARRGNANPAEDGDASNETTSCEDAASFGGAANGDNVTATTDPGDSAGSDDAAGSDNVEDSGDFAGTDNGAGSGNAGDTPGKVLADETPEAPHLSISVADGKAENAKDGAGAKPKRRRRHHKKAIALSKESNDDAQVGNDGTFGEGTSSSDGASAKKHKPRKKSGKKGAKAREANGSNATSDASASADASGKPRKKRHKKRSRKQASGVAGEIAAAVDLNAHPFGPFALVITPTRELAQQIDKVVTTVCEQTGQRAVIVMGGAKFDRQIRDIQRGCDMLVATPGRLIDLMDHGHIDLSQVKVLVLDEADRMLDMGFWPSVRRIVGALPKNRQALLFSATIPPSIKGTVDAMLHDPARVEIARIGETADTVEERLCPVTQGQKIELLEALVRKYDPERLLVFCRTKHRVDDVSSFLLNAGFNVDVMHADRNQRERERALAKFRAGKCKILVATDVMSRGIDVNGIDAVVNFDVPMDPEDYVHRIGRTGRAGHTGLAFTFVAPDEISPLREIEYFTKKLVPVWDLDGFDYDDSRIVPNPDRSTKKPARTMFSGSRARGRGIGAGRYGRHF